MVAILLAIAIPLSVIVAMAPNDRDKSTIVATGPTKTWKIVTLNILSPSSYTIRQISFYGL